MPKTVGWIAATLPALMDTTGESFVNLDNFTIATDHGATVNRAHIFADHVAHAPSRLVGDTQFALDFLDP